jgi:hypothetical protein
MKPITLIRSAGPNFRLSIASIGQANNSFDKLRGCRVELGGAGISYERKYCALINIYAP